MHQSIARRLSAATRSGSVCSSSVSQQLAEQMVVAIPLAPAVEGHHKAVRTPERLERARGPRRLEHCVAQSGRHAVEDRGVREEPRLDRRQPRQELVTEVGRDKPVVAVELLGAARARPSGLERQRREVQAGRPALRPLGQLGDRAPVELDARLFQEQPTLLLVQPELRDADLVHPSLRSPAGERQCGLLSARDRDLRPGRNVLDERREHVQTRGIGDEVKIVEHEHQSALERRECAPETRDARRPGGCPWAGQRLEHLGRERLDPVNCGRDVPHEHHRVVVVAPVEGDPRELTGIGLGPVRKKCRLAVSGRRNDGREGRARRA